MTTSLFLTLVVCLVKRGGLGRGACEALEVRLQDAMPCLCWGWGAAHAASAPGVLRRLHEPFCHEQILADIICLNVGCMHVPADTWSVC